MDKKAAQDLVKKTLERSFNKEQFVVFIKELLNHIEETPQTICRGNYIPDAYKDYIKTIDRIGKYEDPEGKKLDILIIKLKKETSLERVRTRQRNCVAWYLKDSRSVSKDAALVAFVSPNEDDWRFSFVKMEYKLGETLKGNLQAKEEFTPARRFSFLVGKNEYSHPAQAQLQDILADSDNNPTLSAIEKAFSVERVTKRFFQEIANWYFWALKHTRFPEDAPKEADGYDHISVIRLITRLVFCWFVKEKGLIPESLFDEQELSDALIDFEPAKKSIKESVFYRAILQNLFFATLNTEMDKRGWAREDQNFMAHSLYRFKQSFRNPKAALDLFRNIPFLNGGLFECLDKDFGQGHKPRYLRIDGFSRRPDSQVTAPDYLFFGPEQEVDLSTDYGDKKFAKVRVRGLIDTLSRYKFTIEENTPLDQEVALDPELCGKVFENLLAAYNPETGTTARKATGSFYTPREIVDYMVEESLVAYLVRCLADGGPRSVVAEKKTDTTKHVSPGAESRLRHLLAYNDEPHKFTAREVISLITAIDGLKVLDPAVGSGAFPMGILHKLVHALDKLDPRNEKWKERQIQRVRAAIKEAEKIEDTTFRERTVKELEQQIVSIQDAFEHNKLDYGRKLYLIENCIYGVDIQPIAVQIAKMRFFISLIVDQRVNPKAENLGVRSLPNLETKFVAANTLIVIDKPKQMTLRNPQIDALEAELRRVRERHFTARTLSAKARCREQDKKLRDQIAELLKDDGWDNTTAKQLAAWDPYDQNDSAGFFDSEWMFGVKDGFDVVIGNPPYGGSYSETERHFFIGHYQTAKTIKNIQIGSLDTFTLFIEKGFKCLLKNGNLIYIVPIAITSSDSMTGVHKLLEENCGTIKISSYAVRPQPVFENSVVNTSIIFFEKTLSPAEKILCTKMYRKSKNLDLQTLVNNLEFMDVKHLKLRGRYPKISLPIENNILEKIFKASNSIQSLLKEEGAKIFYRTTGGRYYKVVTDYSTGSTKETFLLLNSKYANVIGAIMSSNLFFWFYQIFSNNLDLKSYEIESFKIPIDKLNKDIVTQIEKLYKIYLKDIEKNANVRQTTRYKNIDSFKEYKIGESKQLIDKIDDLICPLYGLTDDEINFIKNYEIRFRLSDADKE